MDVQFVYFGIFWIIMSNKVMGLRLYEENNTDSYLTTLQIIQKYGYPAESHFTQTTDGYILNLHRIPHGKDGNKKNIGPPVYLQHGFLGSSADFILLGPNRSLPFILADEGYDVWLGNIRGNTYSTAHKTMTPEDKKFWDFSWHESGIYDLPAQIDFICNYTQREKIFYIGYSMGTTMFLVMASSMPQYQEKIEGAIFLAAIAYLKNTKSPFRFLTPIAGGFQAATEIVSDGKLAQQSTIYRYIARLACTLNTFERDLCRNIIFLYTGSDPYQFDQALLPIILNHIPAGTSAKTLTHFAQLIQTGNFNEFDYGPAQNLKVYNTQTPPIYDLKNVTTPIYIFEGPNDSLSTLTDVDRLAKEVKSIKKVDVVNYKYFSHLDFIIARDVKKLVYNQVLNRLKELEGAKD